MSHVKPAATAFVDFLKQEDAKDQYFRFEAETDTACIVQGLRLAGQLFPDHVIMLCNRSHPKLQYVSENSRHVLGYSDEDFKSLSVHDFFRLVHSEDLKAVQQCFEFINTAEPYNPETHRFVLYYRLMNKTGKYLHLRDEKLAIKTEQQKYIYFTMFKSLPQDEKFFSVKLDVYQQSKGNSTKVYSYHPRQTDTAITPRQHEIATLIIRGFSNKEIAGRLNLSINTIKNHKQLLFKKTNVRSSIELASYARSGIAGASGQHSP